ncbi:uncharacterized protein LOC110372889 isoform X2 [Helicoverpa armigera]|uniref:uncharacterized protein LOC110372889 isoform X2 n=1 Tax=Helicoverpa armigera TaxID=29058 RepID=UPI000B36CB06|nr:uncharacterized protein LOC110372889 isoform X2 [Helicoverpa armigera]PZC81330.1 hypothetical protein B5X24_HaOG212782 [Helicoverpa armigera]
MQLLHENKTHLMTAKDRSMSTNMSVKDLSDNMEVKEKRSSDASLLLMNPVASGDNVTTGLNSAHKLKEELPPLVPCCEGRELQINEDLVRSGLSAISVKHDSVIQCLSMSRACERMQIPPGLVKHRNSFRSLHRPDLKRVPYLRRMSPDELETLFRGYADLPTRGIPKNDVREEIPKVSLPPDENGQGKELNKVKEACRPDEGNGANALLPILETRSGAEDVPAGMRLHGARARLYTSVLAGARAGDQLDGISNHEEYDNRVPEDSVPDEEVQLNEELQIILPPRYDDVTADSSITTTTTDQSIS